MTKYLTPKNLIITGLVMLLSSCGELFPSHEKFIVISVEQRNKGVAAIYIESVKGTQKIWVLDSVNKYAVGDTLILIKQP